MVCRFASRPWPSVAQCRHPAGDEWGGVVCGCPRASCRIAGNNLKRFANLSDTNLTSANLEDADLRDATLDSADLWGADLTNANLSDAYLAYANLNGATLTDADLGNADLEGATLTSADLTGSNMSASQLQATTSVTGVDLSGNNMTGFDLSNLDLTGATLTGATLTGANLHQALLTSAMPSLPVVNGAVVKVVDTLAVSGSVQVDTGGILSVTSDSFTAAGVNMQGGRLVGAIFGLDLDEIGDISGHGQLFGHVGLGRRNRGQRDRL